MPEPLHHGCWRKFHSSRQLSASIQQEPLVVPIVTIGLIKGFRSAQDASDSRVPQLAAPPPAARRLEDRRYSRGCSSNDSLSDRPASVVRSGSQCPIREIREIRGKIPAGRGTGLFILPRIARIGYGSMAV